MKWHWKAFRRWVTSPPNCSLTSFLLLSCLCQLFHPLSSLQVRSAPPSFYAPSFLAFLIDRTSLCNSRATNHWKSVTRTCSQVPLLGLSFGFSVYLLFHALICQYASNTCNLTTLSFSCPISWFALSLRQCLCKGHPGEPNHTPLLTHASSRKVPIPGSNLDKWGMGASG